MLEEVRAMVHLQAVPVSLVPKVVNESSTSIRIPILTSSLLQLLAPHIMTMPPVSIEATTPPAIPLLALSTLNLATEDPFEEFFNFNVRDFLQLLRRHINMILDGCDFLELGRPMLTSYLDNIERIGGPE